MVAYAKANPGKLSYGSSGTGGPLHMGAEMFKRAVGIDVLHVPYKGNAPATLAILAGEVNLTFDSPVGPAPVSAIPSLGRLRSPRPCAWAACRPRASPILRCRAWSRSPPTSAWLTRWRTVW